MLDLLRLKRENINIKNEKLKKSLMRLIHNNVIIIKSISRKYYELFYARKSDNLSEVGQLL